MVVAPLVRTAFAVPVAAGVPSTIVPFWTAAEGMTTLVVIRDDPRLDLTASG